jgi:phosphopantetheine--protein transferase-like protein
MSSSARNPLDTSCCWSWTAFPPAKYSEKQIHAERLHTYLHKDRRQGLRIPLYILFIISICCRIGQVRSFTLPLGISAVDQMRLVSLSNFAKVRSSRALSTTAGTYRKNPFQASTARYVANEFVTAGPGLNFSFPKMSIYTEGPASIHTGPTDHADAAATNNSVHASESIKVFETAESNADHAVASSQYSNLFSFDLPEGKCVGLRLSNPNQAPTVATSLDPRQIESNSSHWIKKMLHPDEVKYGFEQPSENARMTFYIGRLAMRTALAQMKGVDSHTSVENEDKFGGFTKLPNVSTNDQSILKDEHGRPRVPNGFIGSISHKQTTGVALISTLPPGRENASSSLPTMGVGVDIEQSFSRRRNIAKKILTPNELEDLGKLDGVTRDEEVLLRFSLKESVYKAMHPLICQFVGFQEAEIKPHNDGTATVLLNLKSGQQDRFQEVKAHWRRIDGDFFLTSASVTLKES